MVESDSLLILQVWEMSGHNPVGAVKRIELNREYCSGKSQRCSRASGPESQDGVCCTNVCMVLREFEGAV